MPTWYELEIMPLPNQNGEITNFYKDEYDRSDMNAGFDLHSSSNVKINQMSEFVPFGIVARLIKVDSMVLGDCEERFTSDSHFWLLPRSSIYKSGLIMANSTGVIDKSYRGELKAPVWSMVGETGVVQGDRLFQIVAPDMGWIRNVRIVKSMPETERGAGGFGSTGK